MGIQRFPVEIRTEILKHAYNQTSHTKYFTRLRLVSHMFDELVSRITLESKNHVFTTTDNIVVKYGKGQRQLTTCSLQWMLRTKARLSVHKATGPFAFIQDAALFLATAYATPESQDRYLDAACRALAAAEYTRPPETPPKSRPKSKRSSQTTHIPHRVEDYQRRAKGDAWTLREEPRSFYGSLHLASACGDVALMESFMRDDVKPAYAHHLFGDPMRCAILHDQLDAVRLLLKCGVHHVSNKGNPRIPILLFATESNSRRIADYLSTLPEISVNDECPDTKNTALIWAAIHGLESTVRALLKRPDTDASPGHDWDKTPLCAAIRGNHAETARILLDYGHKGYEPLIMETLTPVRQVVNLDRQAILMLLLDQYDIDTKAKLSGSKTMLEMAVDKKFRDMAKALLQRMEPTQSEANYLFKAAISADDSEILRLLLQRPQTRKNLRRQLNCELTESARLGRTATAMTLLEYDEVDPNHISYGQRPPLYYALKGIHTEMLLLLMKRKDLSINSDFPRGPLLKYLVKNDMSWAISQALKHPAIDVNRPSTAYGSSSFRYFREDNKDSVFKYQPFKPQWCDDVPRVAETPFMMAASWFRPAALKILLQDPRVDTDVSDKFQRTPLWWACHYGDNEDGGEEMFDLILASNTDAINTQDQDGWAPLHVAANRKNLELVRRLLSHPEIDPNVATKGGWTALHMAAENCSQELVDEILMHPETEVDKRLDDGRTALELHSHCDCGLQIPSLEANRGIKGRVKGMWKKFNRR